MKVRRSAVSTSRVISSASFSRAYFLAMAQNVIASVEQAPERFGAGQRHLRMAGKQLEEALLSRHQGPKPSQHERLAFGWSN
jgi:hypothetical protein